MDRPALPPRPPRDPARLRQALAKLGHDADAIEKREAITREAERQDRRLTAGTVKD